MLAIAPDGTSIAFGANGQLYLRSMSDAAVRLVQGLQTVGAPFFSPDGRWLGYISADNQLRKIAVTGGAQVTIADFGAAAAIPFGPVWNADGFIYFGTRGAVERVSANGGRPEPAIRLNAGEIAHRPQLLPDGDTLLFAVASGPVGAGLGAWDRSQIVVQSMKTGNRKAVITGGSDGRYVPTGHIIYAFGNSLFAVPFDLKTLAVGGPVPVIETVNRSTANNAGGADAQLSVADNGSMVYVVGGSTNEDTIPTLVNEAGNQKPLPVPPGRRYATPRFSPDGKQFAVETNDDMGQDVWIGDVNDARPVRKLTFQGINRTALWAEDSQSVAFSSDREGTGRFGIFRQRVDGGPAQRIGEPDHDAGPPQLESWSSDGTKLVFSSRVSGGSGPFSMFVLFPGTGKKPALIVRAAVGGLSSDGRWLTYGAQESGRSQVYVEPFPQTGEKHQVSTENGGQPLWSRDGKRLFFLRSASGGRGRQLVVTEVKTGRGLSFSEEASAGPDDRDRRSSSL
jgi:serine/threonine-protein kinase